MNQHSLMNSACDCVQETGILFLILAWVMALGPQHLHLYHGLSLRSSPCPYPAHSAGQGCLTLLSFTGPSTDKALDTSVLHMAIINLMPERWLNLWVMILFFFICKCFHFDEMEIPYLLYFKLMNRVSVIRSFSLQFKGQEDKKRK